MNYSDEEVKSIIEKFHKKKEYEKARYLIVKDNDVIITLDPTENNRHYIKSMTETTLIPHKGLIDESFEEIHMGPQSSIELIWVDNTWYILSSDGLKTS